MQEIIDNEKRRSIKAKSLKAEKIRTIVLKNIKEL